MTATPCRGDGRGLGGIFEIIIECPQVAPLIEQGYLVKTRVADMNAYRRFLGEVLLALPAVRETRTYAGMEEVKTDGALPL